MALNKRQIAGLIFMPFWYGVELTFKAQTKMQFGADHEDTSGRAGPIPMTRNIALSVVAIVGGLSCGISTMIAMGAAFGSVVPVFGTLVGGLAGGIIGGLLGCTAGAVITKQLFRLGNFISNCVSGNNTQPVTNSGKYLLSERLRQSPAQALLTEIGRRKYDLKQAAGGDFLTVVGGKSLFFNPAKQRCNDALNEAVKLLHTNPEDDLIVTGVAVKVAESGVHGFLGAAEDTVNDFVQRFRR